MDSVLRRHQHAIQRIMDNEEEPIDQEAETDDDEMVEDSTDEEVDLETEDETEEEMQPAQNDPDPYDLDVEMLPNDSVIGEFRPHRGGLLQVCWS